MVVPVLLFAVFFLILLSVILFISIIWKRYKVNRKASLPEEDLEELEVVDEDMDTAIRVIENMQLMELEEQQMISPLANAISGDVAAGEAAFDEVTGEEVVVLENIAAGDNKAGSVNFIGNSNFIGAASLFWRPFAAFSHNPELLESGEEMPEVIYEQDGIHYIKKNFFIDKNTEEKLDNNFMKLVETVVGKT